MTLDAVKVGYSNPDAFTLMIRLLDIPDRSQALALRSIEKLRREALCGRWQMKMVAVPSSVPQWTINPYQEYQQQARIAPGSILLGARMAAMTWNITSLAVQIYDTGMAPEKRIFSVPVISTAVVGIAAAFRLIPILFPACQDMELRGPLNVVLTNQSAVAVVVQLALHILEPVGSGVAS